jgi:hypothetical protein
LIPIKDAARRLKNNARKYRGRGGMPTDAILMAIAVVAVFVAFAAVLAWADHQTSSGQLKSDGVAPKRRSF